MWRGEKGGIVIDDLTSIANHEEKKRRGRRERERR
jgi:hypothetical protein